MFAAIRRWTGDEEQLEEATQKTRETFVPRLKKVEGFHAYYFIDSGSGEVATVSIFQDERGAQKSTRIARSFANEELEGVVQGPPEIIEGTVVLHDTTQH